MEYVLHRKSNCKKIKIRVIEGVVCERSFKCF